MEVDKLEELLRRAEGEAFEREDYETIRAVLESYYYVTHLIGKKNTTIDRLRKLLFGAATEKTADVVGRRDEEPAAEPSAASRSDGTQSPTKEPSPVRRQGHGRQGADAYPGATKIVVPHESLQPGDSCSVCRRGTVYEVARPGVLVRFVGRAPLAATIYQLQKLRCNLCGKTFTAQAPVDVGAEKYDATVASMIGLLKYGSGLPFNRLDGLQRNLEVPLPASTQWDIVHAPVPKLVPAYEELIRQAAQGDVLHNDDTTVKILELMGARAQRRALAESAANAEPQRRVDERSGLFTSGIVATRGGRRIALFFSGRQHAGENLKDVLRNRAAELPKPIQMCDALSRNLPGELETIVAHCLAHGRRQFVEVSGRFPQECRYVLEALEVIYRNDALTRERHLSPAERLEFHQAESGPTMEQLHGWLTQQRDEKRVEPNSALGAAISYLVKHWEKLTLFLRKPGAPLDNNLCERALKKAILHRKNALFYKTQNGARVGDLYMSLIHTCELCAANPFDYLNQLQRHAAAMAAAPENWMPWNYRAALTTVPSTPTN
ncbi:MAG TPA: IS66 family transposase [Terracidiphilus sp.]|nr:IS66 family transposase [Terracidiphilus sp.]